MKSLIPILVFMFFCLSANTQKNIILEKFTNTHCGNCPNAALLVKDIVDEYPNTFWLSHQKPFEDHPFHNDESVALWNDLNLFGVPVGMVDRVALGNGNITHFQSQWLNLVEQQLNSAEEASVDIKNVSYDVTTRILNFDVDIVFSQMPSSGPYKLSAFMVQDSVWGVPQDNYFNDVVGHPLEGLGDEIWLYPHRNVVRNILDHPWGTAGVIPNEPIVGQTYSHSYQYEISEDFKHERMHIVCGLSYGDETDLTKRSFINADKFILRQLWNTTSIQNIDQDFVKINIFPNPVSDVLNIAFSEQPSNLVLMNSNGEKIRSFQPNSKETKINVSGLTPGIHFLLVEHQGKILRKSFVVAR